MIKRMALLVALVSMLSTSRCGPTKPEGAKFEQNALDSKGNSSPLTQLPPSQYYDELFAKKLRLLDDPNDDTLNRTQRPMLRVNFNGATVQRGYGEGQSFLVCGQSANVPSLAISDSQRTRILEELSRIFSQAGVDLEISETDVPGSAVTTIHVGGSFELLGCGSKSHFGAAPRDFGNANPSDIAFAFPTKSFNEIQTARLIAHVSAVSFGLDQTENDQDLMAAKFTGKSEIIAFGKVVGTARNQDGPATLRKNLATSGNLNLTQNSSSNARTQMLLSNTPPELNGLPGLEQLGMLGKLVREITPNQILDTTAVTAELPKLLPAGVQTPGLDAVISVVAALQNAAIKKAQNSPKSTANKITSIIMSLLTDNTINTLTDIASIAGFGSVGAIMSAIKLAGTIILGLTEPTAEEKAALKVNVMPNFAEVMGLEVTSFRTLLSHLEGHSIVIAANFSGSQRDAMASFAKVAYAQKFKELKQTHKTP